ncbi:hypothetical protein JTB14_002905 [Gonioctena quinquepunctata]|nr:hypothetical protein JTB14_002905 [Gonioctena quinquepunctata]
MFSGSCTFHAEYRLDDVIYRNPNILADGFLQEEIFIGSEWFLHCLCIMIDHLCRFLASGFDIVLQASSVLHPGPRALSVLTVFSVSFILGGPQGTCSNPPGSVLGDNGLERRRRGSRRIPI